ncbi:hypothetical protein EV122DRAFT_295311 [Schizophyllum commune]
MATPSSSARDAIVAMAAKYSEGLPGYVDASTLPRYIAPASHSPPKYPVTVLLTGSTGHLGSEILASLLTDERVKRVYTLDRAGKENSLDRARKGASLDRAGRGVSDGATAGVRDRQRARWADKGLDDQLLQSPKLVPLEGDVSAPRFGQSEDVYMEVTADSLASVSVIIHTAWRVNFNHPLDAFEHSIRGPVEDPQRDPHARSVRFLFISSTTAARSWEDVAVVLSGDADMASSPEDVNAALIDDPASCIGGGGYGQSKYVAERILAGAGSSLPPCGLGRSWATTNWFPILVRTSLALGALPTDEQPMPWLPMDVTTHALLDIVFFPEPLEPSYNLVHPRPISFSKIIGFVQRSLASTTGVKLSFVPFKDWMARLEDAARRPGVSARDVPGIKLIPFLYDVCAGGTFGRDFAMEKMMRISSALRDLDPICQADADAWVRYWEECGMFSGRGTDVMRARM